MSLSMGNYGVSSLYKLCTYKLGKRKKVLTAVYRPKSKTAKTTKKAKTVKSTKPANLAHTLVNTMCRFHRSLFPI